MWIKFNKLGIVQEYLKHGNLPEVGDTTFEIFAYFDDLNLNYYNTATIRFQKPDLSETAYPDLLMVQVQRKYVPYVGDSSSSFFQNDHYYTGYVFNFRDFEGPVGWENLPILLDTPGRWKATITLFPSSDAEHESLRNVTGTIEFNVNNSVSYTDELDETNLDLTDIINNISHRLSTQVEKNSGNYVRMANNFTEKAESGELDPTTFLVGTFVYDLQTEKFYKILSTTESEANPGFVEATYEDYKYILDREISDTTRISELYYKYKDQNIIYAEINGEKGFLTVENLVEENENQIVQFKIRFISKNIHRYAVYKSLQGPVGTVGRDFVTILTAEEDTQTEYGNVWVKNYAFDTDLEELDRKKQDVLIPGPGITIENNVISAAGSVVDSELDIDSINPVQNKVVTENINDIRENYQEKLTAGEGVVIDEENVISVVPANDGVLTITQEGVVIGTFSANQAENTTINIDIPEDVVTSVNGKTGNVVLNANDVGALPISGGTLTGDLSTRKLTVLEEGIEIYDNTTPYIDFHYQDSSADYTARIIETPQGVLDIQGNSPYLTVNGNQIALKSTTDDLANRISNLEDNSYVYTEDIVDNLTTDDATKVLSAKQGKVLKDTIDGLDLNQVGADGSYIKLVSQTDGQVSATAQTFDSSVPTSSPSTTNAPTTSAVKSYVDAYGGKIDSISIDGTTQTIDANKNVDLPAYPTKASLGLGNVDNTSDLNKPISTATQAALDGKQDALTETQLNAVNSGITSALVSDINANTSARHTHSNKSILDGTSASFTTTLKDKLDGIESGAEVNDIDTISVNGTTQTITNKNVDITVPTKVSDLTNDVVSLTTTTGSEAITVDSDTLNVVTRDTAQTISGQKTFTGQVKVKRPADGGGYFYINPDSNGYNVKVGFSSGGELMIHNGGIQVNRTLYPSGNIDLGTSSAKWRDLYLSGAIKDGTNTFTLPNEDGQLALVGDIPTNTSDLTNDGDGTSPFATEDYVDTNGGKIDSISVGGTPQTIDANKNVDLPAYPTKASLGLDQVINTGDSATPVSGGTTKLTTGGAYTLQATLQGNIDTVDNKLDVNVHTEGNSDEITYNGDTVTKTSPYQNLKTGATGTRSEVIHLANTTTAGLMSYTDYNQIRSNTARIEQLEGQTRRLLYTASQNPTQNDIATFVDNYLTSIGITPSAEEYAGIAVVVAGTYHIWHYYDTAGVGWKDDGLDTVSQFTNSIPGIIQGKQADGFVYAENDGTGSVYGWSSLKTRVNNLENGMVSNVAYDTTNDKFTQTINGVTSDIVTVSTLKTDMALNNVDNTSDLNKPISTATQSALDLKANASDLANYVDLTTTQTITGEKTFKGGIKIGNSTSSSTPQIILDNSDRIAFYFGNTAKVKMGNLDTLFANRVTPDSSATYDLGRSTVYWRDLYLSGSIKPLVSGTERALAFPAKSGTFALVGDNVSEFTNDAGYLVSSDLPEYSLSSSATTSTGAIQYLEDITYTSASASGTDTFVKTINGGSGSFTPTTRYLHSNTISVVTGMTFNSASAVTGVSGGSMVGTRSTSGSGTSARRTLSISFTPASVTGSTSVMTGVSQTSTDNVITSISVNTSAATGDITYLESATHTHTGASVGTSASAVTGITAGSVEKTTKYATLEEN